MIEWVFNFLVRQSEGTPPPWGPLTRASRRAAPKPIIDLPSTRQVARRWRARSLAPVVTVVVPLTDLMAMAATATAG